MTACPPLAAPPVADVFTGDAAGVHTPHIPALIAAPGGTRLASGEARKMAGHDAGPTDRVCKRNRRLARGVLLLLLGAGVLLPAHGADRPAGAARFRDGGDGTVTDLGTGLVWLRQADALGTNAWEAAVGACLRLAAGGVEGLADRSKPGEWRLPTAHELLTLTDAGLLGGSLGTNAPFTGLPNRRQKRFFWTQTAGFHDASQAFQVHLQGAGGVEPAGKERLGLVWPVKGNCKRLTRHEGRVPDLTATFARLTASEKRRAEINALYDVAGLRLKREFVTLRTKA
ncbi:MAG: DUF1566 domain-containing protein, partial [Lentisphaerae bacterium]|nr:DUF1566 domain-containing protein [Lentisphaerota bacterium]